MYIYNIVKEKKKEKKKMLNIPTVPGLQSPPVPFSTSSVCEGLESPGKRKGEKMMIYNIPATATGTPKMAKSNI